MNVSQTEFFQRFRTGSIFPSRDVLSGSPCPPHYWLPQEEAKQYDEETLPVEAPVVSRSDAQLFGKYAGLRLASCVLCGQHIAMDRSQTKPLIDHQEGKICKKNRK